MCMMSVRNLVGKSCPARVSDLDADGDGVIGRDDLTVMLQSSLMVKVDESTQKEVRE